MQGGGAHGAFTWGVLDRLLEESWLEIDGISGTSAGAMNAVVMASGLTQAGVPGARQALEDFWRAVSDAALMSPFRRSPLDVLLGRWTLDHSPLFVAFDLAARLFSPYSFQSFGGNPLADILRDQVNFAALRTAPIRLFVTATNVRTGMSRLFRNGDLSVEALLASACLPTLYQAVEIDGDAYWDGGYTGNPSITPLVRECESHDTILVQINPIERQGTPRSARAILNRLNEISFNSPLQKELRMIALLRQSLTDDASKRNQESYQWAHMRIHRIASDLMTELGYSSKLNAEWTFLCMLRDEGRRSAQAFLDEHGAAIGQRSSFDLNDLLEHW
ncbi:patatin-like phospholipase family protein [Herbaspirillum robiniae]|uniref:patatin-like phospholipase family protein n=1 Tax=Herbaspirillum robiniae TaxID=2014887 RepID=UPI003D78AFCE